MMEQNAPPDSLEFKPDFLEAVEHWRAFWSHEIIDRPLVCVTAPKDPSKKVPPQVYMEGYDGNFDEPIANMLERCANTYYAGDAMPVYVPSFGPDMFAAFLGADLQFSPEFGTSWAVPFVENWEDVLPLRLREDSIWWRRMLEFMDRLAEATTDKMLISHLDLHSNMDALLAIRTGERLCMDLVDQPDTIERAMKDVRALYAPIYDAMYEAGRMWRYGTTGWVRAYHFGKTNTIQCDFACMIGPDMFRKFVMPALEEESSFLDHCTYHYDGPEALVHFEDVMSIKGIDCIQWVPGAGNKPFIEWMDLLKRVQERGKSVYVPCTASQVPAYHRELKPELVYYEVWAKDMAEADGLVKWLVDNT